MRAVHAPLSITATKNPSVPKTSRQQPQRAFGRDARSKPLRTCAGQNSAGRISSRQSHAPKPAAHLRSPPAPPQPPARFLPAPASRWSRRRARRTHGTQVPRAESLAAAPPAAADLRSAADDESPDCGPACRCRCKARRPAPDRMLHPLRQRAASASRHSIRPHTRQAARASPPAAAGSLRRQRCAPGDALGEDQRLAAGRRAGIEDCFPGLGRDLRRRKRRNLRHQLRAFVLNAHAALAECCRRGHVAGNHGARRGQQLAGRKLNSCIRRFRLQRLGRRCAATAAAGSGRARRSRRRLPRRKYLAQRSTIHAG